GAGVVVVAGDGLVQAGVAARLHARVGGADVAVVARARRVEAAVRGVAGVDGAAEPVVAAGRGAGAGAGRAGVAGGAGVAVVAGAAEVLGAAPAAGTVRHALTGGAEDVAVDAEAAQVEAVGGAEGEGEVGGLRPAVAVGCRGGRAADPVAEVVPHLEDGAALT